jgi:hypothetical protein
MIRIEKFEIDSLLDLTTLFNKLQDHYYYKYVI